MKIQYNKHWLWLGSRQCELADSDSVWQAETLHTELLQAAIAAGMSADECQSAKPQDDPQLIEMALRQDMVTCHVI